MLQESSAAAVEADGADDEIIVGTTLLPAVEALLLRFLRFVVEAVVSSSSWLVEICAKAVFLGVGLILGDSEGFSLLLDEDLLDGSSSLEYDEAEIRRLVKANFVYEQPKLEKTSIAINNALVI